MAWWGPNNITNLLADSDNQRLTAALGLIKISDISIEQTAEKVPSGARNIIFGAQDVKVEAQALGEVQCVPWSYKTVIFTFDTHHVHHAFNMNPKLDQRVCKCLEVFRLSKLC